MKIKKKNNQNDPRFSKLADTLQIWIFCCVWFSSLRNTGILSVQLCSYLHRLHLCQSKYRPPCNSTMPPDFLLYLWDGCVVCKLEFWCLVLDYIVLKFILFFFFFFLARTWKQCHFWIWEGAKKQGRMILL